jgi:2-desacetyl-2-hydroxyethyl bacteriochlorophyllide A dehydrogenase
MQVLQLKSLVWTEIGRIEVKDADMPTLDENSVLLKVKYCGICGSELSAYLGHNELRKPPSVMGHEFSGEVVGTGTQAPKELIGKLVTVNPLVTCGKCRYCQNGDRQLCPERKIIGINFPGGFDQFLSIPSYTVHEVKDPIYGSLAEPLATAVRAVRTAGVTPGDQVMITGAGTIGLFCSKIASLSGASEIVMVETNKFRQKLAVAYGATDAVHPEMLQEFIDKSGNKLGFDRAIDAVGYNTTRNAVVRYLRRGGNAVILGLHENKMDLDGNYVIRNEIKVAGSFCYSNDDFRVAVNIINKGYLMGSEKWFEIRRGGEVDESFKELLKPESAVSKIILDIEHT